MAKRNTPPLVYETFQDRKNLLYLSVIEYKGENFLVLIDNIKEDEITAFVLDFIEQEKIDPKWFLSVINLWYYKSRTKYPPSFEFAKQGHSSRVAPLLKTFSMNYISRVIGSPFQFDIEKKPKVRRKRAVPVNPGIEIRLKKTP